MAKSEHEIQDEIRMALSETCVIVRTNSGTVMTSDGRPFIAGPPNGWPDLTGYRRSDGRCVLIEVKRPKYGRLSAIQKRRAALFAKSPVIYGVATSAEEALKIVSEG